MTQESTYSLRILVTDVFHFKHNVTVFVGALVGKESIQFPSQVTLMIDGEHSRNIVLKGKRMSGDQLPPDYVIVYTDEFVDLDRDAVQRGGYNLVFLPEQS